MKLFDLFRRGEKKLETRQVQVDSDFAQILGAMSSMAGISVSPESAMGAATVFACVRVLANTMASLPIEVCRKDGRACVFSPEHPLNELFGEPNPYMTLADVVGAAQVNLSLSGKAFIEVTRDQWLDAVGLYPTPNHMVSYQTADGGVTYSINGKRKTRSRVIHLRGLSFDGIEAIPVSVRTREAIALALALQENAAKFFGNGSRPSGTLEHPATLGKDAAKRLRDQFEEQATGANAYRTIVLEEGMKYVQTRAENKDSQFLESRDHQNYEICRVFGVPPHKVGLLSGQPRANIEQENLSFISDTIRPIATRWEQELSRVLLTTQDRALGYTIKFNLSELGRGDAESQARAWSIGRQWGWFSINDVRSFMLLPPVEGGDSYHAPLNMQDITAEPEPVQPAAPASANPQDDSNPELIPNEQQES